MADIIQVLQYLGESAQFHRASPQQLDAAMSQAGVDSELRTAVLSNDAEKLATLLGAPARVVCGLLTPDAPDREGEEEPENAPPPPDRIRLAA